MIFLSITSSSFIENPVDSSNVSALRMMRVRVLNIQTCITVYITNIMQTTKCMSKMYCTR
jgi:hypothetical protein